MPAVSVVVPVFQVEPFLAECLQSLARQTLPDLEVVMVDDGSTDGSAAIAADFAAADARFTLVRQDNHGLGHARNTGTRVATGEHLAFADSDDVLPDDAYERLLAALEASGSDFATGNVLRLGPDGTRQAPFLAATFARTRRRTHVTRFKPLLADRTAWNKLFRRSFWDAHDLRFPEGCVHEDIPVMLPAHFMAKAVDVLADPVYLWREREGGERSITQRRLEERVMRDRLTAVEAVLAHIERHGPRRARRWYLECLVSDDLRLHLDLLDEASDAYVREFAERASRLLAGAPDRVFAGLPAIDRLKWRLLRDGHRAELVEVVAFDRAHRGTCRPIRRRGRLYGDYPFREDARLGIPASVYRLGRADPDLAVHVTLDALQAERDGLRVRGHAHIGGVGAAEPGSQELQLLAVRRGRGRAVRMRVRPLRLATVAEQRPELGARLAWSGFAARLDATALARDNRSGGGAWELGIRVAAGGLRRYRTRFTLAAPSLVGATGVPGVSEADVVASCDAGGAVRLALRTAYLRITGHRAGPGAGLELHGEARLPADAGEPRLEVRRRSDGQVVPCRLAVAGDRFEASVPLGALADGAPDVWELRARAGDARLPVSLAAGVPSDAGPARLGLEAAPGGEARVCLRPAG